MPRANGFVFYDGPSQLNGRPILGIATGLTKSSSNAKTGAMIQTYILAKHENPLQAHRSGLDHAICGTCPHIAQNTCYVDIGKGPAAVFTAFQRGRYPRLPLTQCRDILAGRLIRLGSYGDPAAIPYELWETLLTHTLGHTGYTHAWQHALFQPFKRLCMASVDTADEYVTAKLKGWRAFYLVPSTQTRAPLGSFLCPASTQAGKKTQCADCLACGGLQSANTQHVYIPVHGLPFKQQRFDNLITIARKQEEIDPRMTLAHAESQARDRGRQRGRRT